MKQGMAIIILGLLAAITGFYFLFFRKNGNNTSTNASTDTNASTGTNGSTGTGSNNTVTEGAYNTTVINIKNPKFAPSPLIGQGHLTAEIEVLNPPQQGNLTILLSNTFVNEVNLPLPNGKYILDQYVAFSNTMTYNLTAKIGSVTKTVQVAV